jgi:hypothetical protein
MKTVPIFNYGSANQMRAMDEVFGVNYMETMMAGHIYTLPLTDPSFKEMCKKLDKIGKRIKSKSKKYVSWRIKK